MYSTTAAFLNWSARQELHLRSPGSRPGMLLLHHALVHPDDLRKSGREKRDAKTLGIGFAVRFEIGQRGRNCTCGPSVPGRACCCYTTRCWRSRWDLHPHSSRRQRVAFLFSYESKMVGSAGNAPVRHFQFYFATSDLQSDNWIASLKIGSGSGSRTHLKKFMRLLSVLWSSFPQCEMEIGRAHV